MKKKGLFIGIGIGTVVIIAIIIICIIAFSGNSPDKTVAKYCDIMVKGNYGDLLDIAYLPDSEFITNERIEEAKKVIFEKMSKENNDITSCTYSKANETDEKVTYKIIANESKTTNLDVNKKDSKAIFNNLYHDSTISVYSGSNVTVDGKDISKYKIDSKDENEDTYKITILDDVKYKIKITHPIINDIEEEFKGTSNNYKKSIETSKIKDEDFENNITEMIDEITKVIHEDGDLNSINKYFANNNINEFKEYYKSLESKQLEGDNVFVFEFKEFNNTSIQSIQYKDVNKLDMKIYKFFTYTQRRKDNQTMWVLDASTYKYSFKSSIEKEAYVFLNLEIIKQDNIWKINSWS